MTDAKVAIVAAGGCGMGTVAALVAALASNGAGHITDQSLRIDGGTTRHV